METHESPPTIQSGIKIAAIAIIAVFVCIAYSPALRNGLVSDDTSLVSDRALVYESPGSLKDLVTNSYWWATGDVSAKYHLYRPWVSATWWLDYQIGGASPWIYHVTNVILHIGVSILICFALMPYAGFGVAYLAALLTAVGPVAVSSVAWASGRTDLWAAFFILMFILFFYRAHRRRSLWWMVAASVSFFLGLASKETAVIAPAIAWGLERHFTSGQTIREKSIRGYSLYAILGIPLLAYLAIRHTVLGELMTSGAAGKGFPLLQALSALPEQILRTAFNTIVPLHFNFYSEFLWSGAGQRGVPYILSWLLLLSLAALIIAGLMRKRLWAVGGLWFSLALIPPYVSGQAWAPQSDFYAYMGLPGLWLFILDGGRFLLIWSKNDQWLTHRGTILTASGVITLLFLVLTYVRVPILRSNLTLALHSAEREPRSLPALIAVGQEYYAAGQEAKADEWLMRASLVKPDDLSPWIIRAKHNLSHGKPEKAGPLVDTLAVRGRNSADAQAVIARYFYEMGRCDLAVQTFHKSVGLRYPSIETLYDYGLALLCAGDYQAAIEKLKTTVELAPFRTEAYMNLGIALEGSGKFREAVNAYSMAVKQVPDLIDGWERLARASHYSGDRNLALSAEKKFLSFKPPANRAEKLHELLSQSGKTP